MTALSQLLEVSVQNIGQQIAGSELNRVPAQCLADLRHRNTQQRAGIALTHLAEFVTVLIPVCFYFQNMLPVFIVHVTRVGFS